MDLFRASARFATFIMLTMVICSTLAGATMAQQAAGIKVEERVTYNGLNTNIRISNGTVEMIVATEYGPRIMRFAPVGSEDSDNLFGTVDAVSVKTDLGQWNIRGGHRLWHAPEGMPRSYVPDNAPIQVVRDGDTVKLIQAVENATNIQKEIWITLDATGSHV